MSILRKMLSPFVCAIYNGQARDWDREVVFSMLTGKDHLKDDVMAYVDKLFAQHESKTHT